MAFNLQTFRTRTITAAVFVIVMLAGLLWNQWSFFILFTLIHFGCWWEFLSLIEKIHKAVFHNYVKMGFMLMGFAIMLWLCGPSFKINDYVLKDNSSFPVSIAGIVLLIMGIFQTKRIYLKSMGVAALGLLYISLSCGLMMSIYSKDLYYDALDKRYENNGFWIYLWIIAMIWINDTMAYIVGSLAGKTPLSKISPKKTWEGTIGGILLSMLVSGIVAYLSDRFKPIALDIIIIAGITSVIGTFGDLLESKLKRMAGVKDSGHFMPGHGGFLDRFDSLLLAIPAVWLYTFLFLD